MSCKSNTSLNLRQSFFPGKKQKCDGTDEEQNYQGNVTDPLPKADGETDQNADGSKKARDSFMRHAVNNHLLIDVFTMGTPEGAEFEDLMEPCVNGVEKE